MPDSDNLQALVTRRGEIQKAMSAIGDFRQGSLTEMYRKCGKPRAIARARGTLGTVPVGCCVTLRARHRRGRWPRTGYRRFAPSGDLSRVS